MKLMNTVVRLRARPSGLPKPEDFEICEEAVPKPKSGEILVAIRYISISPSLRMQMNSGNSYLSPVPLGGLLRARAVGEVMESRTSAFDKGDFVEGNFGPQRYYVGHADAVTKIDPTAAPIERHLGALGMSGLTAYFGLIEICRPQAGQTLLVSAAGGSVGNIVGQIGKQLGCRVVGIAGGAEKCAHIVNELNFDTCLDYRSQDFVSQLGHIAPNGVDMFFDNVGGDVLDAALANLALGARIAICGAISAYNDINAVCGPKNYLKLLEKRASMTGFNIYDFAPRYAEAQAILAGWIIDGTIKAEEHMETGLTRFAEVIRMMFDGAHRGKLILKVGES